jgi:radical SAM protein with 4Fe4S-binding SPASM domain
MWVEGEMSHLDKQIKHTIPEHLFKQLQQGPVLTPGEIYGAQRMWELVKSKLLNMETCHNCQWCAACGGGVGQVMEIMNERLDD